MHGAWSGAFWCFLSPGVAHGWTLKHPIKGAESAPYEPVVNKYDVQNIT